MTRGYGTVGEGNPWNIFLIIHNNQDKIFFGSRFFVTPPVLSACLILRSTRAAILKVRNIYVEDVPATNHAAVVFGAVAVVIVAGILLSLWLPCLGFLKQRS